MRRALTGVLAVAALLGAAPAAHASTLTLAPEGTAISIVAAPGEVNDVTLTSTSFAIPPTGFRISDTAGLDAPDGQELDPQCTRLSATVVDCILTEPSDPATSTVDLGDGDDRFQGSTTNDTVDAGPGDDLVSTWFGDDSLTGGPGDDLLHASMGDDIADGGEGDDTVTTETDDADFFQYDFHDVLRGGPGADVLDSTGSFWNGDPHFGEPNVMTGNHTLDGGPGDDELITAFGDDNLIGGDGHDVAWYDRTTRTHLAISGVAESGQVSGFPTIDENDRINLDVEEVRGGPAKDEMIGSAGPDRLVGNGGDDQIHGGGGDDVVLGGLGADVVDGEGGFDTTSYADRGVPVAVTLDGLANDGVAGEGDRIAPTTEHVIGGEAGDTLTGGSAANVLDGAGGNDTLDGRGGADMLEGGAGIDTASYAARSARVVVSIAGAALDGEAGEDDDVRATVERVIGSAGPDRLTGNASNNRLDGGPGRDTLDGRGGADTLDGGPDLDRAIYTSSTAPVTVTLDDAPGDGAAGEGDNVRSTVENLVGSRYADTLTGSALPNGIAGGPGDDVLRGLGATDLMYGQAGEDQLWGGDFGDGLFGGDDDDRVYGEAGNDQLYGQAGTDRISGGPGPDILRELDGFIDQLLCGSGADVYRADPGDDVATDCEAVEP